MDNDHRNPRHHHGWLRRGLAGLYRYLKVKERKAVTNNNHTSPENCACSRLTCASFVAGNQCFRCEQVDNQRAGITFDAEMDEWNVWFNGNRKREEAHEQSPDFRPATGFCT